MYLRRFGERVLPLFAMFVFLSGTPVTAEPIRIIVFGDSLTSGYQLQPEQAFPAVLEQKLRSDGYDVSVLNMSIPGETTSGGIARINSVTRLKPDIVILELGANDALRGLQIEAINSNIYTMIDLMVRHGISVIVCGMKAPPNMGRAYASRFNKMLDHAANMAMVYPFMLEGVATVPQYNLADGYHPNANGVRVMVNNFYPYIIPVLRQRIKYLRDLKAYEG
jgi:acyl-CoA thioesterase I